MIDKAPREVPEEPSTPLRVIAPDPAFKVSVCVPIIVLLKLIAPLLAEVLTVPAPVKMTAPGKTAEPVVIVLLPKFRVPEPNDTELA
jgi:hypothetical protein